ncbi:MAG: hypothetical protein IT535_05335 [Bauldia sp.]|nr:hypothetical protein [Bauldia sp.]
MKFAASLAALSLIAAAPALAQDGEVYQQGDYFIDNRSTNCGEAQTVVADRAEFIIQERNAGIEIIIDRGRFDPLPHGVKLFIYYQFCTNMFFLDEAMADNYATGVGLREGWMTTEVVDLVCDPTVAPVEMWPDKPDAARCTIIAELVRNSLR